MQGRALTNSQACFLNNALSAFAYLHRWPLNAMSSGRWLALERIGLLPALSSRRSAFLVASERSLCFYHKAGIGVEKKRRERERERRQSEREKGGGEREREQAMKVKACHGCRWLVSPLPTLSNPFSTHGSSHSLTHTLTLTHARTHAPTPFTITFILFLPGWHAQIPTHFIHFVFLLTSTHTPLLFWSFIQRINRNLHQNIRRQGSSLKFR